MDQRELSAASVACMPPANALQPSWRSMRPPAPRLQACTQVLLQQRQQVGQQQHISIVVLLHAVH